MRSLNKRTFLIGDLHGKREQLLLLIRKYDIRDSNIIILGDCGVGFCSYSIKDDYEFLNTHLELNSNKLYYIRGNHDNPEHWYNDTVRSEIEKKYPNIIHLLDGEVIEIFSKKYLVIGGGISFDRITRNEGVSYWKDEYIRVPELDKIENLEGILSHVGPLPISLDQKAIAYWSERDNKLAKDINDERMLIEKIGNTFQPKKWFFGHFHLNENFEYTPDASQPSIRCHCLSELSFLEIS